MILSKQQKVLLDFQHVKVIDKEFNPSASSDDEKEVKKTSDPYLPIKQNLELYLKQGSLTALDRMLLEGFYNPDTDQFTSQSNPV